VFLQIFGIKFSLREFFLEFKEKRSTQALITSKKIVVGALLL